MNKLMSAALIALLSGAGAAWAGGEAMTDGEVRKIDRENQKITLKHGELKNLGMPGMTMVFQVKDAALLDKVKAGDKVRFNAEKADSGFVVTQIEAAK
jgi:Cu(I)/Ag(I) efflux system protein CusF